MAIRRTRRRALDVFVVLVAACLIAWPLLPSSTAATVGSALREDGVTVDEKVKQSALISQPLNGEFSLSRTGKTVGHVDWDVYTSANEGFKLSVSTDGTPAMRDSAAGSVVGDYRDDPAAWSVGAGDRRFGFSSEGDQALPSIYGQGTKWRGFSGRKPIEVARRRTGPVAVTRTKVWLASEMRSPLPSTARPKTWIIATAMMNI